MPLKYSEAFKKAVIQRYEHGTLIPVLVMNLELL